MSTGESSVAQGPLTCVVVTPEMTVLETKADFLVLPLFDGELGVDRRHSPMIGRLGFGELRIRSEGQLQRFYVDGGFVQVAGDVVSILTDRALPASEVDQVAAEAQLQSAFEQPASGQEQLAIRERNIARARGQIRVAQRASA